MAKCHGLLKAKEELQRQSDQLVKDTLAAQARQPVREMIQELEVRWALGSWNFPRGNGSWRACLAWGRGCRQGFPTGALGCLRATYCLAVRLRCDATEVQLGGGGRAPCAEFSLLEGPPGLSFQACAVISPLEVNGDGATTGHCHLLPGAEGVAMGVSLGSTRLRGLPSLPTFGEGPELNRRVLVRTLERSCPSVLRRRSPGAERADSREAASHRQEMWRTCSLWDHLSHADLRWWCSCLYSLF